MNLIILNILCLISYCFFGQMTNKESILLSHFWYIEDQSINNSFSFSKDTISLKTDGLLEKGLYPDYDSKRYDYWQLSFDSGFNERNNQQLTITKIEMSSKIKDTLINKNCFTFNSNEYCTVYFDSPHLIEWDINKSILHITYNKTLYSYRISKFRKNEITLIKQP